MPASHPAPACTAPYCPVPQVLRLVVRLYEGVPQPDYAAICQCLMLLDDWQEVATILFRLLGWVLAVWEGACRCLAGWVGGWAAALPPLAIPAVAADLSSRPLPPHRA